MQHMVYVLPTKHVLNALRSTSLFTNLLSFPFTHPHRHTHTHTQTHTLTHTHKHTQIHTQRLVSGIDLFTLRVKATLFQCNGMQALNKVYKTGQSCSQAHCAVCSRKGHTNFLSGHERELKLSKETLSLATYRNLSSGGNSTE